MNFRIVLGTVVLIASPGSFGELVADPCGMVPPINSGQQVSITRTRIQQTYVFHKNERSIQSYQLDQRSMARYKRWAFAS